MSVTYPKKNFLVEMQSLKSAPAGGACSPQDADFYWGYDDLHLHLQKNLKCRFLKNKAIDYQADCPFGAACVDRDYTPGYKGGLAGMNIVIKKSLAWSK